MHSFVDLRVNKTPTALGPKNERIKKENIPKNSKSKPPPEPIVSLVLRG